MDTKTNPVGRPTKYKEEYNKQAYKLCLLGYTNDHLADFFEVDVDTIKEWLKVHEEFSASVRKGKDIADAQVAKKLYERATGYSHPEVDIKMYEGQIIQTNLIKHYPPDTAAAIIWLKNRQPRLWRDKQEIEQSGSLNLKVSMSKDEMKEIAKGLEDEV